jgi:hypothetical protein
VVEEFEVYVRDIYACMKEQIKENQLCGKMNWWPSQKFLCLVDEEVEILDDADNGTDRWDNQSTLGGKGVALPFHIFADGSLATTFNRRKFHPAVARNGLVPMDIQHGTDFGGGVLMGLMPSVDVLFIHFAVLMTTL